MALLDQPPQREAPATSAPKRGLDRKALLEEIGRRYEHTLRRLGR